MSGAFRSAIYTGRVTHHRLAPRAHKLSYNVFCFLVDLDELAALSRSSRLFSWNRRNIVSFYEKDHGGCAKAGLKDYILKLNDEAGTCDRIERVALLCYPRLWGYSFNPLSVYYCFGRDDQIVSIVYEVRNTFGDRHSYVLPNGDGAPVLRHSCPKKMHVSPFMPMNCEYRFRIRKPEATLALAIAQESPDGAKMHAGFKGTRRPLSDREILGCLLRNPLMTFKVIAGIHWEAFKLWRKGLPFHKRPEAPNKAFSVIPTTQKNGETLR